MSSAIFTHLRTHVLSYSTHTQNNSMTKNQFGAMMKALQKEGKFKFPSEEKLQAPSLLL